MAKIATPGSLNSSSLQSGGGGLKVSTTGKRKTPSELRGEQLKQANFIELVDESPAPTNDVNGMDHALRKPEPSRNLRYIDTRMDEVFPVKKSRFRMLSGKENVKESNSTEQTGGLKNITLLSNLAAKRQNQRSCPENSAASAEDAKDSVTQTFQTIGKCSQSMFRSVSELSSGGDRSSGLGVIDMDKALKGLVAREPAAVTGLHAESSEKLGDPTSTSTYSDNFCSECHVPGRKTPLDLTLKSYVRMVSSSPVNQIHRSIMSSTMPQFTFQFGHFEDQNSRRSVPASSIHISSSKVMQSWVYPQSTLPTSLISVLTSSAAEGVEMDFLRKRQFAWEDSFRNLYYMLRNNACNLFYVCTSHFVVMFNGGDGLGRTKRLCNAYISRSTRGLRSLLRENDVCFSMPLCHTKVEQVSTEDLVELSEIENQNLGQTRRLSSSSDIDNSPQSLLVFCGNKNVHGLYDFLLNYRSFLSFLTGIDVPFLCSPVPFQNAAISAPEVRCMELKRADHIAAPSKGSSTDVEGVSAGLCYCIEIKDSYLPPWILCRLCDVLSSEGRSFEASFITEPTSIGLNVALEAASDKSASETATGEGLQESGYAFGIPGTTVTPCLYSGLLKGLKYTNGSYSASLSPI